MTGTLFSATFIAVVGVILAMTAAKDLLEKGRFYGLETEDSTIKPASDVEWWKNAVLYQIYPKSYMDSDGDGIGDLKGIIQKLEHLKDAGITAAWLSPIYQSPQVDQGYDISDYEAINQIFGTMEDFENLVKKAKQLGLRIILDFVPNHTSDEHEWFKRSENKTEGYEDYYVWFDEKGNSTVPNNWISAFRGSAWTYSSTRDQYYYHAFHEKQPDLNYRNPHVVNAMKDVLTFWMDKGVDGFRIDAVPFLFESEAYLDEPTQPGRKYDINDESCLRHIYTQNLNETYDMIYQWRQHIEEYVKTRKSERKIMMVEVYATTTETMLYYGSEDGKRLGAHFPFNFNFLKQLSTGFTVDDVVHAIDDWLDHQPKGYVSNWVLGNHDNHRVGSRLGEQNMDAFNMITAFLPGVMITYYGEEIGMLDGEVTCEQGQDNQATQDCSTFNQTSRDFERTPFQWDNTTNAGFTNGTPWLPVASDFTTVNLGKQTDESVSHYELFKELVQFRSNFKAKSKQDDVVAAKASENVLELVRQRDEAEYILLFNIGEKYDTVEILRSATNYKVAVVSSVTGDIKKGDLVSGTIRLEPHASVILVQSDNSDHTNRASGSLCSVVIVFMFTLFVIYY